MRTPGLILNGIAVLSASGLLAQNLLPNPAFETPGASGEVGAVVNIKNRPLGWELLGCAGEWRGTGTNHVLAIEGDGANSGYWRSPDLALEAGGLYALHFRARRLPGASGGSAIAGTSRVNRDFRLDTDWRDYRFFFRQPDNGAQDYVRLGQWQVQGGIEFDDVELLPALASHRSSLGEAETVRDGGTYRFTPNLGWLGANFHRPLRRCTASFNSDRWVFSAGSEVVYRFGLDDIAQTKAEVSVAINYHVAGRLHLEASKDGEAWTSLGTFDGNNPGGKCELPANLLPASAIFVRLSTPDPGTSLQVNRCDYEAHLGERNGMYGGSSTGSSDLLEVLLNSHALAVSDFSISRGRGDGRLGLRVVLSNLPSSLLESRVSLEAVESSGRRISTSPHRVKRLPDGVEAASAVGIDQPGDYGLLWTLRSSEEDELLRLRASVTVNHMDDPRASGYPLPNDDESELWWCESGFKILRGYHEPHDGRTARPVTVSAAGGETEGAQLVLFPQMGLELAEASTTPFVREDGVIAPISLRLYEVARVEVTVPTDNSCERRAYPDPLPPLQLPFQWDACTSQPLWLSFHIPRGTPPGDYSGKLRLEIRRFLELDGSEYQKTYEVPLAVHVYGFDLPRETHLRSALGLGTGEINRYHKLTRREDQIAVFEKYLQNFAEHRISPYSFFDYAPIKASFEGEGADKRAKVDFTEFDRWAERWLDGTHPLTPALSPQGGEGVEGSPFNTFRLPLRGMGGGTFHSRHLGELEGFQEGTPEHARLFKDYLSQVEAHLREKGWLDEAFTYWFDEPDPKDYEFVVAGQDRIKAAAPGLKRMLTEQPEPELMGHVDIWCGLTPEWTPEEVRARRDAGEEVWWYICTAPKAPYVTEFIDHPGTELRLWPWQSWQYGVSGILIWATIYWTSPLAYPDSLQDPWEDPMSWVTGYGRPVGTRSPWGNGDGRFLYPPRRDPNTATDPCLDAPISSIRWENLRDGMEDYEYFWLLDQEVKRVASLQRESLEPLLDEARALLVVPEDVSKDLTHFTTDPRTILAHRDKIARMIETLVKQR